MSVWPLWLPGRCVRDTRRLIADSAQEEVAVLDSVQLGQYVEDADMGTTSTMRFPGDLLTQLNVDKDPVRITALLRRYRTEER